MAPHRHSNSGGLRQRIALLALLCLPPSRHIWESNRPDWRRLGPQWTLGDASVANTIALVDDDRNILTSVSMALEAEGFAVRCFSDGAEALKGMTAQPVDLAVLDIKMPRVDGMELLSQLRKQSHSLPVIFLTSKDDEVDELLGLRMGADDYIKKPFSQRLLIERIRALLRREVLSREGPAGGEAGEVIVRGELTLDSARHLCTWG